MPRSHSRKERNSTSAGMKARHCAVCESGSTLCAVLLVLWCAFTCVKAAVAEPAAPTNPAKEHMVLGMYRAGRDTLQVNLHGKGTGVERFLFRLPGDFDLSSSDTHLISAPTGGSYSFRSQPATLSLFDKSAFLFFTSRRHNRLVFIQLARSEGETSLSVRRGLVQRERPGQVVMCGRKGHLLKSEATIANKTAAAAQPKQRRALPTDDTNALPKLREVEMEIHYESSFAPFVAEPRRNYIASLIYATNQLYLRRMGIEVRVTRYVPLEHSPSHLAPLSSEELLERFRSTILFSTTRRDLAHLFTGEPPDFTTAGLAYVGAACVRRGQYAVGLSRSVSPTLQMIVFAHEVMHGLGAKHDSTLFSVMSPVLSASNRRLSQTARQAVSSFISDNGRCIRPLRPPVTSLDIGFPTGQFDAVVMVDRPRSLPCEVYLQGRMLSGEKTSKKTVRNSPWHTIAEVELPLVGAFDQSTISFSAPAPVIPAELNHGVEFRALVRCAQRVESSRVQRVKPPNIDINTATGTPSGDWIEQLTRSIRVQAE